MIKIGGSKPKPNSDQLAGMFYDKIEKNHGLTIENLKKHPDFLAITSIVKAYLLERVVARAGTLAKNHDALEIYPHMLSNKISEVEGVQEVSVDDIKKYASEALKGVGHDRGR